MTTETQQLRMWDGTEVLFYPKSHRYKNVKTGEWIPSVSQIVGTYDKSEALLAWNDGLIKRFGESLDDREYQGWEVKKIIEDATQLRRQELKTANDAGTITHDYCVKTALYRMGKGEMPEIPSDAPDTALTAIQAFMDFEKHHSIKYLEVERLVYNPITNYIGRFDALAEVDDRVVLIDYKTSKGVYPTQFAQAAGYAHAYTVEKKGKAPSIAVAHFDKETGSFKFIRLESYARALRLFNNLLIAREHYKLIEDMTK